MWRVMANAEAEAWRNRVETNSELGVTFRRRFWAGISAVFTQLTTVTMAMPRGALRIVLVREWIAEQPSVGCITAQKSNKSTRFWQFLAM
jgi:hypothetical protein